MMFASAAIIATSMSVELGDVCLELFARRMAAQGSASLAGRAMRTGKSLIPVASFRHTVQDRHRHD
jgi:hypothetical protein